ncbi:hypothetical protein [Fulvivirga sp. M361]|uniref:endo-beta-N-acetylglucosaminidase n=1 Tax=Fulvivirga sp. M361 TaxID=2594266 RepID=UPI001629A927|nr:hypothetical protein [Fulvivirga sp. M361]
MYIVLRSVVGTTLTFLLFLSSSIAQPTYEANQPYSSYWFINEFLQWNPEKDPHAKFNVSHVALKARFVDSSTQLRPELSAEPSIVSLVPTYRSTSKHPSQGFQTVEEYAFPFWQYIDYFVQWGGSAGEGLIVTPAVPWVDAAHRNGVKVLGTVFFPPNAYGGKEEWVREFLRKDEQGNFPVADKMIEVAGYYGFEGWFINQETKGLNETDALNMQAFLAYYQQRSKGRFKVMWYDAMIEDGRVIWQDELNHHNSGYWQKNDQKLSDILFIDFGWSTTQQEDSHQRARDLGRSPWELYSGIDVQQRSYKSPVNWKGLYKNDKPYTTSIGLYWPSSTFNIAQDKQPESVYLEEQKFWNGTVLDEDVPAWRSKEWKGFARYFPARSVLSELPFVTNFNYGLGRFYNEKGKRLSDAEWHNLSNQDILPTWQWQVDTTKLAAAFDFNESYNGGSCLRFDFKQKDEEVFVPLYKTNFDLQGNEKIELVAKGKGKLKLTVNFANGTSKDHAVEVTEKWQLFSFKTLDHTSERIVKIGIKTQGNVGDFIHIGQLAVRAGTHTKIARPTISCESFIKGDKAEVYLHIESDKNGHHHNIYQVNPDKSKTWLGQTHSTDYYLPALQKGASKTYAIIEVVSVAKDGSKSKGTTQKVYWQ